MMGASGTMAGWSGMWAQGALLTVGAAVVLGVALRWVAAAVREATHAATTAAEEATQAAAEAVTGANAAREYSEAAAKSREQVAADLASLDERIQKALSQERLPVVVAARSAAQAQTPSALRDAILKARDVGTLGRALPMVAVQGAPTFWVRVDATADGIRVQLGRENCALDARWIEISDDDVVDRMIELGQQIQELAPEWQPEPRRSLAHVPELLELGGKHSDHFGLFAKFGDWGSAPKHVIYLGDTHRTQTRRRAVRNPTHPNAPQELNKLERRQFVHAQLTALNPRAWFETHGTPSPSRRQG